MSITVVSKTKLGAGEGTTTPAIDTTGADAILIWMAYGGAPTLADNKSNDGVGGNPAYVAKTAGGSGAPGGRFYLCLAPHVGAGHTWTVGGGATAFSMEVVALAGVLQSSPDSTPGFISINADPATFRVAITPPEDNCAIFFGAISTASIDTTALTPGAGLTLDDYRTGVPSTQYGSVLLHVIQTTAATISASAPIFDPTPTWDGMTMTAMVLKAAPVAPPESITLTSPKANSVRQRSGTSASVTIAGTTSGTTENLQYRHNGGAWTTFANNVNGAFSVSVTLPQDQGTLEVRKATTTSTTAQVLNVGVGDVWMWAGDSNAEGRIGTLQNYSHATLKACVFRQDGNWKDGIDPIDSDTTNGSILPLLATRIMADQGVCVGFITVGTGSTDVVGTHNEWAKPNSSYNTMATQLAASGAGSVKGVIFSLGPNAIVNGGGAPVSQSAVRTALDTLATNCAADLAGAPKIYVPICGEVTSGASSDPVASKNNFRLAVISAWTSNGANVKPGWNVIEQDYTDNVHFGSAAQGQVAVDRLFASMKVNTYGGTGSFRGPRLISQSWNGARTLLTLTFDQNLKTGLTHATQPFAISDNGSAMTINAVAYGTGANQLTLTPSAAATGPAGTTTVSFASGDTAVNRVIPLGTDITLAGGGTANLPAEVFVGVAVTEVDVTPPALTLATGAKSGTTTATGSVTTNEAGTLYKLASQNAVESDTTIIAAAQSSVVSGAGVQNVTFSGLTPETQYYNHFVEVDSSNNVSNVVHSAPYTTDAVVIPPDPEPSTGTGAGPSHVGITQDGKLVVIFPL